jgi:hypothetical protein
VCQGAKDTGLDATFPDSELCHSTTHREVRKFSVLLTHRHPEPRNLKFHLSTKQRAEAASWQRCCEEMALSLEVEVVLLDIGRSFLFGPFASCAFKAEADASETFAYDRSPCIARR